jgi:CRISPR-associated protein Csd1
MLLQRLVERATDRGEDSRPHHRGRVFDWRLDLAPDGTPQHLEPLVQVDTKGRSRGVLHSTPSAARTVGVAANLAADDVQYVFGWADDDTKPERVAQCHRAFADLAIRWADSDDGRADPIAQAVAAFYRSGHAVAVARPPEIGSKQGVLITVDDEPAYDGKSVVPFWLAEVERRKGGGESGLCLVCGHVRPLMKTVPAKVRSSLVPGASNDAALVSVNERVFGYDLETQLGHTPLCLVCGEAFSAGLTAVLESPHSISYGDQDSRMAWWTVGPKPAFDPMALVDQPDPAVVNGLLASVAKGEKPAVPDMARFCSLTVGGNVARVMVRDWVDMPLRELLVNVAAWFADHEIDPRWPDGPRHHRLISLVVASGRWQKDRRRYAELGAKGADRPNAIQRDLLRVVLHGAPPPPALLGHLLHRITSDGRLDDARAALLRLCVNGRTVPSDRSPSTRRTLMPGLDPTNTDPFYVSGRLFALLEQVQYDASGGKLNTTYGDRYFTGAVSNPRAALVQGRKDAKAWLRKLRRDAPGKAVAREKTLDELFALLDAGPGLPSRTSLRQQATFLLGYHHHRADHFARIPRKTDAALNEETA